MESLDERAWAQRTEQCRAAMEQLRWMLGRWRGRGETSSGIRVSDVETRLLFDGTFVESRERVYATSGELESDDITIYGAAPEKGPNEVWAHLYMLGGITARYAVNILGETMLCEPEGYGARLSITQQDDGYRVRVYFPDGKGNWIEDAALTYERVE